MLSKFSSIPELLAIDFSGRPQIDACIYLYQDGTPCKLKGVMYYGSGRHFTSHIVRSDKQTWFHDGVDTGVNTEYEASLGDLMNCRGKLAKAVLYTREPP